MREVIRNIIAEFDLALAGPWQASSLGNVWLPLSKQGPEAKLGSPQKREEEDQNARDR